MKNKKTISLLGLMALVFFFASYTVKYKTSGTHPGSTGAPGDQTCAQMGCHADAMVFQNSIGVNNLVFSSGDSTYFPGVTYTITIQVKKAPKVKFGFECVALKDSDSLNTGQIIISDPIRTQLINHLNGNDTRYSITHQTAGTPNLFPDSTQWTFKWTAPSSNVGKITFWYATNCTNNNGQNTGDQIYLSSFTIKPNPSVSVLEKTNENNFKAFYNNERKEVSFSYKLNTEKNVRVVITDQQGKEVLSTETKTQSEGRHKEKLLLSNEIKPGIYFVQLQADNSSYAEKIIVQ